MHVEGGQRSRYDVNLEQERERERVLDNPDDSKQPDTGTRNQMER